MKNKKALKALDKILIIIGISTLVFTIMMFIFFFMYQSIPDTLCERFYTVIVGECGVTGLIQIVKTICNYKYNNELNNAKESLDEVYEGDVVNE